jgi:uncharacterized protein with NRDE domain
MLFGVDPGAPLVVAANRDERLERAATAVTVLSERDPRMLGGRDGLAGGTWLAVNEHGVVAGLTNRPAVAGRDPTKRSRGELPLWLAAHRSASAAAAAFARHFDPSAFNPCWLMVGDRDALFVIDLTGEDEPAPRELGPGAYVLENSPLGEPTPKREHVAAQLAGLVDRRGMDLLAGLGHLLADHRVPDGVPEAARGPRSDTDPPDHGDTSGGPDPSDRPAALSANCVHIEGYGTRSSLLCRVPASPVRWPEVLVADGSPCVAPMRDVSDLWRT